jgi:hypothetical protein
MLTLRIRRRRWDVDDGPFSELDRAHSRNLLELLRLELLDVLYTTGFQVCHVSGMQGLRRYWYR